MSDVSQNNVEIFSAEEQKGLAEMRMNTIVESIARQRDNAFNALAKLEAELAVSRTQVSMLSTKIQTQASALAQVLSDLNTVRGELASTEAERDTLLASPTDTRVSDNVAEQAPE